ncbi:hypothetical protein F5J12DRAFT_207865 [Pisolithus orientalis]|uniref:uncharacterized protein n=1 Tax=Pisolithus orientalis TaxID=936130 RepID=UPI0022241E12|nr:uncharacterized protein F5J12DRAFT_207865 [Pisolithus orientalis]KAI6002636.1 hypothetical protein F5J12DRAFT_207865 [Pisolithus orientalis]
MRSCPSYLAQLPNMHLVCDRSPPPLSRDATSLQHGCDPSHMLRGAVPKDRSDGEDAVCQDRTIPPSTFSPSTILSEYHQHFPIRLTRTSALAPGFGTYGTRDHALLALYVADNAKYAEATMQPPYARSVPPNQAHTLNQMDPVWNAQSAGLGNPAASYSTHHPVDENEGSLMYTPGTLYVSDDTKYAEATTPPDARTLPHNQAHTLNQMNPVWNVQYAEHGNPVTSYSTPLGDESEGSLMLRFRPLNHRHTTPIPSLLLMPSSSLARLGGLRNMVMQTLLTSELSEDLVAAGTREPFSTRAYVRRQTWFRHLLWNRVDTCLLGAFQYPHVPQSHQTSLMAPW